MVALRSLISLTVAGLTLAIATPPALAAPTTPAWAGQQWTWPVGIGPPEVVRGFDPPAQPWEPGHRGVDLATAVGAPVRSAGAGVVTYAGLVAGVGVVTVTHGELRTTYQPVAASVSVGERVEVGQPIGTVRADGSHCPPASCLHWGLLRGDTYLDPLSLVTTTGRPRLLPLGSQAVEPASLSVWADAAPSAQAAPHRVSQQAARGALAGITER